MALGLGNFFLRASLPAAGEPVWFYPILFVVLSAGLTESSVIAIAERSEREGGGGMNTPYGISIDVDLPYDEALEKVIETLKSEGFGVLTTIDVKATMKAKLGVDFRSYVILGACNPKLAHEALSNEIEIGLLLPCNVIAYERDGGGTTISAMNALAAMTVTGNPALEPIAREASDRLTRALNAVKAQG
jgi:uncharacterized protein (DUF302 family)